MEELNKLIEERNENHKKRNKLDIQIQLIQKGVSTPSEQQIDRFVRLAARSEKVNNKANAEMRNIQRQLQADMQEIQSEIDSEIKLIKDTENTS